MKLGFASDHRGYALKEELIKYFEKRYEIVDCGTNSDNSCDYPVYAYKLGKLINNQEINFGIAICGSGIGISVACNKIKGVYCAKVSNKEEAYHTRHDNNTNCVALGENTKLEDAIIIIETFINTNYSNLEKHNRRNSLVKDIESGVYNG